MRDMRFGLFVHLNPYVPCLVYSQSFAQSDDPVVVHEKGERDMLSLQNTYFPPCGYFKYVRPIGMWLY